jgi:hypothetical protein
VLSQNTAETRHVGVFANAQTHVNATPFDAPRWLFVEADRCRDMPALDPPLPAACVLTSFVTHRRPQLMESAQRRLHAMASDLP